MLLLLSKWCWFQYKIEMRVTLCNCVMCCDEPIGIWGEEVRRWNKIMVCLYVFKRVVSISDSLMKSFEGKFSLEINYYHEFGCIVVVKVGKCVAMRLNDLYQHKCTYIGIMRPKCFLSKDVKWNHNIGWNLQLLNIRPMKLKQIKGYFIGLKFTFHLQHEYAHLM